ncbi:TraB/GumN family protein [Sulfurovum sp. bin170]|uniref:TraB/GumN family protein n=1 Tax=Sulfurovum sp. bin170 TaxID=2695268 RepID=UPI0013E0698F|nr:TraB/GumN family protein [Sulfurovum sp. bin170]NEW60458.1 TraB/GumN family protein [Sulfurovum sp. bin170]
MRLLQILVLMMSFSLLSLANQNIERPFLWEVKKGNQHFYLFGTMHLADPKLQILPKALKEVIDRSDIVRTEIPMDASTQLKATSMMIRTDGKKLKDILPSKLYARTGSYLNSINPELNLVPFESMKVWVVSTIVTTLENQLKYPDMRPIDTVIYHYAKSQKKDVGGVETIEEQLSVMDSFTLKEQILGLESSLDYLDTGVNFTAKMKELYMRGDSKDMMSFIESMMFQMPKYKKMEEKFMKLLLYDRNVKMAKKIEKLVTTNSKKQSVFAFGVMHFLGEKSVIEILEHHGYIVKRVN